MCLRCVFLGDQPRIVVGAWDQRDPRSVANSRAGTNLTHIWVPPPLAFPRLFLACNNEREYVINRVAVQNRPSDYSTLQPNLQEYILCILCCRLCNASLLCLEFWNVCSEKLQTFAYWPFCVCLSIYPHLRTRGIKLKFYFSEFLHNLINFSFDYKRK